MPICPELNEIYQAVTAEWPKHQASLNALVATCDASQMNLLNDLGKVIFKLTRTHLRSFAADYRWMCHQILEEEIFFRRHDRYQHTSFADVESAVYGKPDYMNRYLNGLLFSHLCWFNHLGAIHTYATKYLPSLPKDFGHLEIGPGHGLYLLLATRSRNCQEATGIDISQSSLRQSKVLLDHYPPLRPVNLVAKDALELGKDDLVQYDSIVLSEVLEHVENPKKLLTHINISAKPGAKIFINIPINAPAPDHIYHWGSPEEIWNFMSECGLEMTDRIFFPQTGFSEAKARRQRAPMSCCAIAFKPF